MSSGNWLNGDNLYLEFGTTKSTVAPWGDYDMPGGNRVIEGLITCGSLNAFGTVTIVSGQPFFPAAGGTSGANSNSWFIEKVELIAETAMTTTSSPTLSIGLIQVDRLTTTNVGGTVLVNAEEAADLSTGAIITYTNGSEEAGSLVGTVMSSTIMGTGPYYITATLGTANAAAGSIRVRIYYRGIGTITQ